MGANNNGSWRDIQQRTEMMAKTAPAGLRAIQFGKVRCIRCNEAFTAEYVETTGRALVVAGGVQQTVTRLRIFCMLCGWAGTPEDARRWLAEHKEEENGKAQAISSARVGEDGQVGAEAGLSLAEDSTTFGRDMEG